METKDLEVRGQVIPAVVVNRYQIEDKGAMIFITRPVFSVLVLSEEFEVEEREFVVELMTGSGHITLWKDVDQVMVHING